LTRRDYPDRLVSQATPLVCERIKMLQMNFNQLVSSLSAQTTVPVELLLENDEFLELLKNPLTYGEMLDWVNENY
jgi:hypothetical protein